MRDMRHPAPPAARRSASRRPAARLLVVVLGLLGFVVGPVGAGAHGAAPATGAVSGVRTAPVQQAPARTRTSAKSRTAHHTRAVIAAVARHAAGAAAPGAQQPVHAALPASGTDVPPPAGRARPPAPAPAAPDLGTRVVPRDRAPPSTRRI